MITILDCILLLAHSRNYTCLAHDPDSSNVISCHYAGYKTCALTNNWIDDIGFQSDFHGVNLGDYFNVVVESSKVGLRKPDKSIYLLACQLLNVEPHNVRIKTMFL